MTVTFELRSCDVPPPSNQIGELRCGAAVSARVPPQRAPIRMGAASGYPREMPQCAGPGSTRAIVAPGFPASRVKGGRESREDAWAVQNFFGVARARSRLHAEAAVSANLALRSGAQPSELQSLMRSSYAVFCM